MEKKSIARAIRKSLGVRTQRQRTFWSYGFLALLSIAIFVLFWCTNVFRDAILSNLALRNGTPSFSLWQRPPVGLEIKVYVFNYTNVREFENGTASKLKVQEVGPFVYRETLSRVNVQLHENQTVTYQEKRSFRWISGKSENERVIVPNVSLISTLAYSRNLVYLLRIWLTIFLSKIRAEPFLELPVGQYLWGYEDELFEMAKRFALLEQPVSNDKFGILAFKDGLNPDRITVHTGTDDLRNLGMIQRINGLENHKIWGDEKCDRIYGTDGSIFPPHWIQRANSTIYVYAKDFCRQLPFRYDRRHFSDGIPTLRYKLPSNVFTSPRNKDSCFCPKESYDSINVRRCPPVGTFNLSACKFGTPVLVSFPHFYSGEESLFEKIDGLMPRQEHHESYIDLHPRLGVTVGTGLRFQLNLEVRKAVGVPFSGNLQDGSILPLIWLDVGLDDMPESIQQILYRSHYLANAIEAGFQWCSLVGAVISFGALFAVLKKDDQSIDAKSDSSKRHRSVTDRTELDPL
ncbi:PREDICTED: lysosome membrane protein 2-like [Eufriesea mexicana]|uniref:lysosome membrane protein 2-like n=1 Tax=Eufriesea mexicana TaxID=516756 RepID=UPI00083C3149|nr:PREDICTED: lysosome membrane protein 2-like [Eufriesea mexicana]